MKASWIPLFAMMALYASSPAAAATARLFAPDLVRHHAHSAPTFTPDGTEVYWSTVNVDGRPRSILRARLIDGRWSDAELVPFSGDHHDDQPFITADGSTMLFASKRPQPGDGAETLDIWRTTRTEDGWSDPEPASGLPGFWTPTATLDGDVYYLAPIDDHEAKGYAFHAGIFMSRAEDGGYSDAVMLPESINRRDCRNWCPFIDPDGRYLIFSSNREGGFGSGDLYVSFRDAGGGWGEPVNLGPDVNTELQERFPGVSPDGGYLFFTRWRAEPNLHDMYVIDAGVVAEARRASAR